MRSLNDRSKLHHLHPSPPTSPPAAFEQATEGLTERPPSLRARENHSVDLPASSPRRAGSLHPSAGREHVPAWANAASRAGRPKSSAGSREAVEQSVGLASDIDILDQTLISAEGVAAIVPPRRRGRRLHRSTFHRWCAKGLNGIVLPSVWIGGQRYTSVEALKTFIERVTEARDSHHSRVSSRPSGGQAPSSAGEARRHQRVEERLKQYGL